MAGDRCRIIPVGPDLPAGQPSVTVYLSPGEPEVGIWCPRCLLPSAIRVPILSGNTRLVPHMAVTVCQDCGERLDEVP